MPMNVGGGIGKYVAGALALAGLAGLYFGLIKPNKAGTEAARQPAPIVEVQRPETKAPKPEYTLPTPPVKSDVPSPLPGASPATPSPGPGDVAPGIVPPAATVAPEPAALAPLPSTEAAPAAPGTATAPRTLESMLDGKWFPDEQLNVKSVVYQHPHELEKGISRIEINKADGTVYFTLDKKLYGSLIGKENTFVRVLVDRNNDGVMEESSFRKLRYLEDGIVIKDFKPGLKWEFGIVEIKDASVEGDITTIVESTYLASIASGNVPEAKEEADSGKAAAAKKASQADSSNALAAREAPQPGSSNAANTAGSIADRINAAYSRHSGLVDKEGMATKLYVSAASGADKESHYRLAREIGGKAGVKASVLYKAERMERYASILNESKGKSASQIAKEHAGQFGYSLSTVRRVTKQWEMGKCYTPAPITPESVLAQMKKLGPMPEKYSRAAAMTRAA